MVSNANSSPTYATPETIVHFIHTVIACSFNSFPTKGQ
ncbi:hypothetical protein RintRC_5363 [Richelia intracellularis]|nr:hypothetical protein RintRC_5363 [Richelia intracellularis]